MIYGIDFDGTIVEEKFPAIGKPIEKTVNFIRRLQAQGHKWVLITMREGKYLDDAVEWLKTQGLTPDAINDNLPERIAKWGNNPRKIYADIYIDDHNAGGVQLPGNSALEELRYIVEQFSTWYNEGGCPKRLNPDFPCSAETEYKNDPETEGDFDERDCWKEEHEHGCWVEYYRWKYRQKSIAPDTGKGERMKITLTVDNPDDVKCALELLANAPEHNLSAKGAACGFSVWDNTVNHMVKAKISNGNIEAVYFKPIPKGERWKDE